MATTARTMMMIGRRMNVLRRQVLSTKLSSLLVSRRTYVTTTRPQWEKVIMPVPTMGDSITEGTIVEWTVDVGQAVQEGDVIALIETDKVTVDIKAKSGGVVTQRFGNVDDTVEVGAKLYEIDSEGIGAIATSSAPAPARPAAKPSDAKQAVATVSDSAIATTPSSHRTPSIHFLGKSGWQAVKKPSQASALTTPATTKKLPSNNNPLAINVIYDSSIGSTYGRPNFSEAEMEALIMGGATLAPSVVSTSSGASFSP